MNAQHDPEAKSDLLAQQLNVLNCQCGLRTEVATDLLYHDMVRRVQIWLREPDEDGGITLDLTALNLTSSILPDYTLRVVRSQQQLLEKIRIFDAGLDDRVIEVLKLLVWAEINPHSAPGPDDLVFLRICRSWLLRRHLVFVSRDAQGHVVHVREFDLRAYDEMVNHLTTNGLPTELADPTWRIVGRVFAEQTVVVT